MISKSPDIDCFYPVLGSTSSVNLVDPLGTVSARSPIRPVGASLPLKPDSQLLRYTVRH